jgi:hypothetical protein
MYSVRGDSERYGQEKKSPLSFGLRDVVLMHPDDVIALKAWVLAKRMYERELTPSPGDRYVPGRMPV